MQHLLIIPDGSRRHAKREYLLDRLRSGDLRCLPKELGEAQAARLWKRIEIYAETGKDDVSGSADLLDAIDSPPSEFLSRSYERGSVVIDDMLRWVLSTTEVRVLTIYGMQARNLCRTADEVNAFVTAEARQATAWAADSELCARCSFAVIGDRALLDRERENHRIEASLGRFIESCDALTRAARGSDLRVNLLAPYDRAWEIEQAVKGERFDPSALPIPEEVDLVIRTGAVGRSALSGALPYQTAFSVVEPIPKYFPDCSIDDIARPLAANAVRRRTSGQ